MNPFYSPPSNKSTSIKFCYASPPRQNTLFSSSYLGKSSNNYNAFKTATNLATSTRLQQKQDLIKKSVLVRGKRQQKQNLTLMNKTMGVQSLILKVNTQANKPKPDFVYTKQSVMQANPLAESIIFHPNHQFKQYQQYTMNHMLKQTQPSQSFHFAKTKPQLRKIEAKASNAKIGEFIIGEMLGKGSIGRVFLVKHIGTNFYYALKIIRKKEVKDLQQLIFGIKTHCFLNHPNLAQLYACFNDQANIYLLMELCANGNLSKYRKKIKSDEERDRIVTGIAKGIHYMHQFNIRHGDLKLQNILINHGFPKVTDFDCIFKGNHKHFAEKRRKSKLWGSPAYFSPDMMKQSTFSLEDDIWSLGVIMYEVYCNSHPFNLKDTDDLSQIINKQMNPIGTEVKQAARNLITRMLEKERDSRAKYEQIEKYGV